MEGQDTKFGFLLKMLLFTTILFLWNPHMVTASFNLYIGVEEVKTLLGLSNELYYVREGVPNIYALQFTVPVPPNVDSLHFTWQSLGPKPLPYTASMEFSESVGMFKPIMNISSRGSIPTEPQTFQIYFPCTGAVSDEVNFQLTLNVTSMTHLKKINTTTVILKRRRICLKDSGQKPRHRGGSSLNPAPQPPPHFDRNPTTPQPSNKTSTKLKIDSSQSGVEINGKEIQFGSSDPDESDKSTWIFIFMGVTFGLFLILLVLALTALAYLRNKKDHQHTAESSGFLNVDTSGNGSSGSSGSGGSLFIRSDSPHHYSSLSPSPSDLYSYSAYNQYQAPFYSEINTNNTTKSNNTTSTIGDSTHFGKLAEMMTIPRCKVRLQSVILEGKFAKVYNGTLLERDGSEKKVIVKTVNDNSSPVQMALLLHEGLTLVGMNQQHVSSAIGVAAEDRVPPFLIYPDDGFRNLKRYLQLLRSRPGRPITAQELVHMAIQMGSGVAFLHRQKVVHGDIGTRNCIVDDKLMVKVGDSALSRDLFPDDYHWTGETESRPIKWMAPEAIIQNRTSAQADMWSFGVLLWEVFTLAQQPYQEIQVGELVPFLKRGYRLPQPINCPDELYSTMSGCWTWEGDDRPKWSQVLPELQELYAQLAQYV